MIGDLLVAVVIALATGGVGLWFGIVMLAPRLQRGIDRAEDGAAKEPDGPAD